MSKLNNPTLNVEHVFAGTTDVVYPNLAALFAYLAPVIALLPERAQLGFDANHVPYAGPVEVVALSVLVDSKLETRTDNDEIHHNEFAESSDAEDEESILCAQWCRGTEEFVHLFHEEKRIGYVCYDNSNAVGGSALLVQYQAV